jgi:SAM-dependent methyltransferase
MFTRSARIYDAMYGAKDYRVAADRLHGHIQRLRPGARELLDVGCGTGLHLEHLADHYSVQGLDLNPELLAIARQRCPEVPFHEGDMVEIDLGQRFDVVTCLFSSIGYVRTVDRLHAAVARMAAHVRPQGIVVVEPWFTPDAFWARHLVANFHEQPDLKVAWMYVHDRRDDISVLDIHYLVGEPQGVEHFTEHHELGLFTDADYREAFAAADLRAEHDAEGLFGRGLYLAVADGAPRRP